MKAGVAVFGAGHVDRLLRLTGATAPGASNPGSASERPGGVGFNVARSLVRLGVPARMAARLGDDAAAAEVIADARRAGVELVAARSDTCATASYTAVIEASGALLVGVADMAIYDEIDLPSLRPAMTAAAATRHWHVDANLPSDTIAGLAAVRPAGTRLSASAVSPAKAVRLAALLSAIDLLFCNRGEAEVLAGLPPGHAVERLADALGGMGVLAAVVSDGAAPLAVLEGGRVVRIDVAPAPFVASANGAGDALAAGTLSGLVRGLALVDAVRLGIAAASLKLEVADPVRPDLSPELLAARVTAIRARELASA